MKKFRTLYKYERRMLFPSVKNRRADLFGGLTSLIITLAIAAVFGLLLYSVAGSYLTIKVDKVSDPTARAHELVNAAYTLIILVLGGMCLEKMRSTLTRTSDKPIFLRLPVKSGTIFRAKFTALLLWTYAAAFWLIIPVNAIFYFTLDAGTEFLIGTAIVYVLVPMVAFLIATLLILPYIIIVNFLSTRYLLTFIVLTGIVVGAFYVYSNILSVLQGLFETSSIKFIFSHEFLDVLMTMKRYTYPANSLASILLGIDTAKSLIISAAFAVAALVITLIVTRLLYRLTLYRDHSKQRKRVRRRMIVKRGILGSLMRKEFITVFREPKYLFSYFTIAFSMPFMVYCCYTLFDTLIFNALGLRFEFSLSLIVLLVFTILTNTFCATNVTRDGKSALKAKIFPIKASKIMFSKVLFCSIISSLSVLGSVATLYFTVGLTPMNAIVSCIIGLVFSLSQIFIATRSDLNRAVVGASAEEVARISNRTIAKAISVGMFFAILIGFVTLFVSVFAGTAPDFLGGFEVKQIYVYLIPAAIAAVYFLAGITYYSARIEKAFARLTK